MQEPLKWYMNQRESDFPIKFCEAYYIYSSRDPKASTMEVNDRLSVLDIEDVDLSLQKLLLPWTT